MYSSKKILLMLMFFGCSSDVSIMKRADDDGTKDTNGNELVDNTSEPSDNHDELSPEPSGEMSDLTIGYSEIYFRQIACPACVGESSEFDVTAKLKFHQPTSGDYTEYLQSPGTCTTNLIQTYVSSQPLTSNQPAAFNGMTLNPSSPGEWYNGFIYE